MSRPLPRRLCAEAEAEMTLAALLAAWKNVEIANRIVRLLGGATKGMLSRGREAESSIAGVRDGFFSDRLFYGDTVRLTGRLSQFCPIYFPVAYAPQLVAPRTSMIETSRGSAPAFDLGTRVNPALTAMHISSADGHTLAFLFEEAATETPRIVSFAQPDRTTDLPFPRLLRGLPVLIDRKDEGALDEIVELRAQIVRLDQRVAQAISESDAPTVRSYYHDFYRSERYPNAGYVLDARHTAGGRVRRMMRFAPFYTSIGIEVALRATEAASPDASTVQSVGALAMRAVATGPIAHYQPGYYTPGGYPIIQLGSEDLSLHVAPSLGVLTAAVRVDVTRDLSASVEEQLNPLIDAMSAAVGQLASGSAAQILHASDPRFVTRWLKGKS